MKWEFNANISQLDSQVWNMHVDVPKKISTQIKAAKIQRLVCTFNNKQVNHCSLMSHGNGRYFVMINKEFRKLLGVEVGDEVQILLREDETKYGMPMPEEVQELLNQDPDADRYFHALSPGKQRTILYLIGKPKGSDTRLKKALSICEYLKSVEGKLDFREMNKAIKNSRFKL